ncbi:MAG: DegT/DnrJ/EryC1/StrS family aminotransferase [Myxococcales bacterium]|nr:DegT/DnrJ/EryC1/StrS family aminotransferase [Myxococcales bacterium]
MNRIPITRPALGPAETENVVRVVQSGWITQGPEVAAFEKDFAAAVGAPHAVALSNCTVAIEVALRCLGVGPGDEVVTASHSFIATANAVVTVGARPVFADIEADTYGLDPRAVAAAITPRTKAILAVHQIGIPCDLAGIAAVAGNLPIVEDAACAIGSEIEWQGRFERIGRPHGVVACFSLHPRKIVTTGDGGMITTADPALAARVRLLRQHAMSVPDTVRHHSDKVVFESYTEPAFNYRMTDLQAAVGRPQLARLDAIVAERRRLADRYREALADNPVLAPPTERSNARSNWQSYPTTLRPGARLGQVEVMQRLMDAGIACKRGVANSHQEPAYVDRPELWRGGPLPVSERMRDTTVLLPLFHGMTAEEQDQVVAACQSLAPAR